MYGDLGSNISSMENGKVKVTKSLLKREDVLGTYIPVELLGE